MFIRKGVIYELDDGNYIYIGLWDLNKPLLLV
jgi:hypothetical protein